MLKKIIKYVFWTIVLIGATVLLAKEVVTTQEHRKQNEQELMQECYDRGGYAEVKRNSYSWSCHLVNGIEEK